jgi:hypothetical protein
MVKIPGERRKKCEPGSISELEFQMDALRQISERLNAPNYEKIMSGGLPFIGIYSHRGLEKMVLGEPLFTPMSL